MRASGGLLVLLVTVAGCAGGGSVGKRFAPGTEPDVTVVDVEIPDVVVDSGMGSELGRDLARLTLQVSNPNDWPMTLLRVQAELAGDVSAAQLPGVENLRLEIPAHESEEVVVEMLVSSIRRQRATRPGTSLPPGQPQSEAPVRVDLRVRLHLETPEGKRTHATVLRRIV